MKFKKVNVNNLIYASYNPRKKLNPDDKEYQKIKNSIEEFGYVEPIIINKDNTIIGGHQRLTVLKDLGYEEVDVIQIDIDKTKEKALNIALNKITGEWDMSLLGDLLLDLDSLNYDLEITGFDLDEIESIIAPLETEEKEVEDDFEVELPKEPKAKYGDIYQLGNHLLMCGDSTKEEDIKLLIGKDKIDMVYTDAPYGISIVNNKTHKVGAGNLAKNKEYLEVKGDDTTETAKKFFNICNKLNIKNYILWGGNYFVDFLPFSPSWIIWDKRLDMNSNNFADGEMAWCSFKTPVRIYHQVWNGMIREGEREERVHPTQKPIKMQTEILKDFTKENDNILDCFGGSGSTLIACEKTNRNCYMIEYEPKYVDVIINRWETFTGKKAIKIKGEN